MELAFLTIAGFFIAGMLRTEVIPVYPSRGKRRT